MLVSEFDYDLPAELIAQAAIEPRHDARLLLVERLEDIPFRDLASVLGTGDCLVVNTTRVRRARLVGRRTDTGGSVEVLLTERLDETRWRALVRPARRLRKGISVEMGAKEAGSLSATLLEDPVDGVTVVSLVPPADVEEAIEREGAMPLPPYFHGTLDDDERYQSIFAQSIGSAAAPTASLHFTPQVVDSIAQRGVDIAHVELHVGLDTFRPMTERAVEDHVIHTEHAVVPEDTVRRIAAARRRGGRVVAVGTTVIRALESAAVGPGILGPYDGPTDLFIMPGYRPRIVDAVITNFHAPRTTLLVLIAALMGPTWRDVYQSAIDRGMRFLSFGDAMFFEVDRG